MPPGDAARQQGSVGAPGKLLNAREQGCALKDIYLGILQPALREVGHLWHLGQISVAHRFPLAFGGEGEDMRSACWIP